MLVGAKANSVLSRPWYETSIVLASSGGFGARRRFLSGLLVTFLAAGAAGGCFGAPTPVVPLPSIHYSTPKSNRAPLVLLMPGRRSRAGDFESNGFVSAARDLGLEVDLVAVDAHLGYYLNEGYQSLPLRIETDVVRPLLLQGPRGVWLVGTSLGALGSLAYLKQYPGRVSGALLLGPYLGEDAVLDEIEAAGGLSAWKPSGKSGYDYEIRTWVWLKQYADRNARAPVELYLGYGKRDSYHRAADILAGVLPANHVFVSEQGGHDWATWLDLWKRFLASKGHRLEQPAI